MAYQFDPLKSLKDFNLSNFYDQYTHFIDLTIYFMIFMGLTKVTLGKKYSGKGGDLLCIGVSLALSFGMILFELESGFTMKTFGGVAILTIFAILMVLMYMMLRSFEASRATSAAGTYMLLFFGVNAVSPEVFTLFLKKFPSAHLLFLVGFFASFGILIWKMFHHLPKNRRSGISSTPVLNSPGLLELKEEEKAAKEIKHETKNELKEAKIILHILEIIHKRLHKEPLTNEFKGEMTTAIRKILNAEHEIEVEIQRQKDQFLKIESATDKNIKSYADKLKSIHADATNIVTDFKYKLQEFIGALRTNSKEGAIQYILLAIECEKRLKSALKDMKSIEGKLVRLIKRDEKKAKS